MNAVITISLFLLIICLKSITAQLSCDWTCTPIKSCPLIFEDLVAAKVAQESSQNDLLQHVVSRIKKYLCDKKAESVCCPRQIGHLVTSTNTRHQVFAVNNVTIMFRSQDRNIFEGAEPFFWRQKDCFPGTDVTNDLEEFPEIDNSNKDEVTFELPPNLLVYDSKCLSIWKDKSELGYGYLEWNY